MSAAPEIETGFGTGLRAQLQRVQDDPTPPVECESSATAAFADDASLSAQESGRDGDPDQMASVRAELEVELAREREMRTELEHQIEALERELAVNRDRAVHQAAIEQEKARVEAARIDTDEQLLMLKIQRDQVEGERLELAAHRTELEAEQARIDELARHIDSRAVELEAADQERAQASSHLAQELASIASRERDLKRERTALDEARDEQEKQLAAREKGVRALDQAALEHQRAVAEREIALHSQTAELERARDRLQERADALASREAALEKQHRAREKMLANSESAVAAWEARLRGESDRLDRERNGQGQASQEAFALLAELEQRDQRVTEGEARLLSTEQALSERTTELARAQDELRLREARMLADVELHEDKLEQRERNVAEREELIEFRERDLNAYIGELQGRFSERNVA